MRSAASRRRSVANLARGIAAMALPLLVSAPASLASDLEPWRMTRSLQLVQDRIADGDHAAMPMQRRLIEMIDERLRRAEPEIFEDNRNFDALLIYGISGGNPSTFDSVVARLTLEEEQANMALGVLQYLVGNPAAAKSAFEAVTMEAWSPDIAAFAALVKGSVLVGTEPAVAVQHFDKARLLSPGTLVEEAALRRAIAVHVTLKDHARFIRASNQYARRFLRSPYASQFAQTLIAGIAEMYDEIDRRAIEAVIDWMNKEQAQSIYLRLARRAAIDGKDSILDFASAKARQIAAEDSDTTDARSMLYSTIASVTSDTVDSVVHQLRKIDRRELSSADLALLEAAEAIAAEVVARPRVAFDESDPPFPDEDIEELRPATRNIGRIDPERALAAETETRIDSVITSARDKLDAIDRMLKEDAP